MSDDGSGVVGSLEVELRRLQGAVDLASSDYVAAVDARNALVAVARDDGVELGQLAFILGSEPAKVGKIDDRWRLRGTKLPQAVLQTRAMPELTKQIRLRATDEEKSSLETAAANGGYANVSDYLRHFLFDNHVLIVGDGEHGDLFRLIPAYSSVEAEREAALLNLEGLLQLGEQLKAATAGLEPSPAPEAVEPGSSSPAAGPVPPVQAAPAPVAAVPPPQAPLAAVPEQTVADGLTGPVPAADENFDAFMERRVGELTLIGLSSMRASLEAEAEWRSAVDQAQGATPAAAAVEAVAAAPAAFCSRCGTALGGPFCSSCGTPAA